MVKSPVLTTPTGSLELNFCSGVGDGSPECSWPMIWAVLVFPRNPWPAAPPLPLHQAICGMSWCPQCLWEGTPKGPGVWPGWSWGDTTTLWNVTVCQAQPALRIFPRHAMDLRIPGFSSRPCHLPASPRARQGPAQAKPTSACSGPAPSLQRSVAVVPTWSALPLDSAVPTDSRGTSILQLKNGSSRIFSNR